MIRRLAIAALIFGACGDGINDNIEPAEFDAGPTADAAPLPDAEPELPAIEAFCAPDGPFDQAFATFRECGGFIRALELTGTDVFTGTGLREFCLHLYEPMVDDGTLVIDAEQLDACSAYASSTSCDEIVSGSFTFNGTPCEQVLLGTVPTDGECELSEQCEGEAFCAEQEQGCSLCTPRFADGEACSDDEECVSGRCNSQAVCAAPKSVGEACLAAGDCAGALDCGPGGTCVSLLPSVGDACSEASDCSGPFGLAIPFDIGLYCDDADGTCQPVPSVGEACAPESVLELSFAINQGACNVLEYEWCDNGTCAEPAVSALGEPCHLFAVAENGARQCESGLICSNPNGGFEGELGTCQQPGYFGATCDVGPGAEMPCSPFFPCDEGVCSGSSGYEGVCPASE